MNAKPVTVVAQIRAKAGSEEPVRQQLLSLIAPSRKDAGCLNYDLHQAADDSRRFMFYENWASQAHLEAHLSKPELQAALGRLAALTAEPPQITLWEQIGQSA